MADDKPPIGPEEESKKDTVRINLPPGLTGRNPATQPITAPPVPKPKAAAPAPPAADEEAKKETAVMGRPVTETKPKSDTSRVQVAGAKPAVPETPRPTVKLRREEEPAAGAPAGAPAPEAAPAVAAMAAVGAPASALDAALAVGAMVLSLAVLGYLAVQSMG